MLPRVTSYATLKRIALIYRLNSGHFTFQRGFDRIRQRSRVSADSSQRPWNSCSKLKLCRLHSMTWPGLRVTVDLHHSIAGPTPPNGHTVTSDYLLHSRRFDAVRENNRDIVANARVFPVTVMARRKPVTGWRWFASVWAMFYARKTMELER